MDAELSSIIWSYRKNPKAFAIDIIGTIGDRQKAMCITYDAYFNDDSGFVEECKEIIAEDFAWNPNSQI